MSFLEWAAIVVSILILIDVYTLAKGSYRYAQQIENSMLARIKILENKIKVFEEERSPRQEFDEEKWLSGN